MSNAPTRTLPDSDGAGGPLDDLADVMIVTSQACHLCEDAMAELARRGHELRLTVIGAETPGGTELVQRYRPAMFPLVLVDGVFVSSGRLPRRKLDRMLAARTRQAAVS